MRQEALETVFNLAKKNSRVIFVGSDLGFGTLKNMSEELPNQFFMEGISEQYLVGFVSGLAKEGYIPYVNTIANFFSRRAFEQISMDTALHHLPVRFLASGGGMVYAPLGPTHTAIEDIGLMSMIPGMRIFSPVDGNEMKSLINYSLEDSAPWYIRFGKGDEPTCTADIQLNPTIPKFFGEKICDLLIVSTGVVTHQALSILDHYSTDPLFRVSVVHIPEISNLHFTQWKEFFLTAQKVLVIEEHIEKGGLFNEILFELYRNKISTYKIKKCSLPMTYSHNYGNQRNHLEKNGLLANKLINLIENWSD